MQLSTAQARIGYSVRRKVTSEITERNLRYRPLAPVTVAVVRALGVVVYQPLIQVGLDLFDFAGRQNQLADDQIASRSIGIAVADQ